MTFVTGKELYFLAVITIKDYHLYVLITCFDLTTTAYAYIYTGAELRNWWLFFGVPVLHTILPTTFLNHFALLVTAVYF